MDFFFKSVSADLRRYQPEGARLFLTLFAMPQSQALAELLRKDLELKTPTSVYRLYREVCIPVGKIDEVMKWSDERVVLSAVRKAAEATKCELPPVFQDRLLKLDRGEALSGHEVFLPDITGLPLQLNRGFALWPDGCVIPKPIAGNAASVLLTVSGALQAARENPRAGRETSLFSGQFAQTVLGPTETFTRFNDAVIQAAFLRAAYPAELDYRALEHASSDVSKLVEKWIGLAGASSGAAAPEFLLALQMKKLRLRKEDMQRLQEAAGGLTGWVKLIADQIDWDA